MGHESIEPVSPLNRRISCEQTISPVKFRKFGKFTLKRRINSNPSLILINSSLHDKSHRLFDREQHCMNNTSFFFFIHNREQKAKNRTFILRFSSSIHLRFKVDRIPNRNRWTDNVDNVSITFSSAPLFRKRYNVLPLYIFRLTSPRPSGTKNRDGLSR